MENEKPKCTVRGSLRGGRAMCGYVIVGGEFCSLKPGECNLQAGAEHGKANGTLADLLPQERECCGTFPRTPHRSTCAKYLGKFKHSNRY